MPADRRDVERALLYATLAVRAGLLDRMTLAAALRACAEEPERPPEQVVAERSRLDAEADALVRSLMRRHLDAAGGDPAGPLAALAAGVDDLRPDLAPWAGHLPGLDVTLTALPASGSPPGEDADPDRTTTFAGSLSRSFDGSATEADFVTRSAAGASSPSLDPTRSFTGPAGAGRRGEPGGDGSPLRGGRFAILRPLARGNLGEIHVARDLELNREVALKEIRPDRGASEESRARFVLEGEITGGLEHPGIVPVYSLGVDRQGRPYYAMRLIRGESLREAIARFHAEADDAPAPYARNLELRRLLRRFIDVCNAMAYAHSRGIVHRDLKPANIMLGPFGETLVVDWGLAKPLGKADAPEALAEALLGPESAERTRDGSIRGTPAYMSPQQADGRPASPAHDIYSLGATLYTLLVGTNPFPTGGTATVLEQVRRGAFARPREVNPLVPPALESICLKAMALEPADRYDSARALADDVERWLADEPIAIHAEGWSERATRWERKHRTLIRVAGAAAGLIAVVSTVAAVLLGDARHATEKALFDAKQSYNAAETARIFAVRSQREAEARSREVRKLVDDYLVPLVDRAHASPDIEAFRRGLAATTADTYRLYLDATPDEPGLPMRAVQVFRAAANVHRLLGEVEPADELYADALRWIDSERDPRPDAPEGPASMRVRVLMDRGTLRQLWGRLRDAEADHRAALEHLAALPEGESNASFRRLFEGALRLDLSVDLNAVGRPAEALEQSGAALERLAPMADRPDATPVTVSLRAMADLARAASLTALDRRGEAEAVLVAARDRVWPRHRARGLDPNLAHVTATVSVELARLLADDPDRRAEALQAIAYAYPLRASLYNDHNTIPAYRRAMADLLALRATLRLAGGERAAAESDLRTAGSLLAAAPDYVRDRPAFLDARAVVDEAQARLDRALGRPDAAFEALDNALALRRRALAIDPDRQATRDGALSLRLQLNRVFASPDGRTASLP